MKKGSDVIGGAALLAAAMFAPASEASAQSGQHKPIVDGLVDMYQHEVKTEACNITFSNAARALVQANGMPNTGCEDIDKAIKSFVTDKVREAVMVLERAAPGLLTPRRRTVIEKDTRAYWTGTRSENAPLAAIFEGVAPREGYKPTKTDVANARRYLDGDDNLRHAYRTDPIGQQKP